MIPKAFCSNGRAESFLLLQAEGEFDAAEIDRELISARLKQDVLEHSGKIHLYIADSVRIFPVSPYMTHST